MQDDVISIIVPVFNLERELPQCLDSILAQTYRNIEIIVIDDGSKDHSADVMRDYARKDERIKPIFQANGGVTSARLHGVAKASGKWVGFVDGDDEIEPDMYERLLRNAIEYEADISHCGYQMCFADGRTRFFHNTGELCRQDRLTAVRELLSGVKVEPGLWNKLFRKTLLDRFLSGGEMPLDIRINEDLLMNFLIFSLAEQTVFEDWCPYHYIVRTASASRAKLNEHKIYDPIRVKDIIRKSSSEELRNDAQRAYLNTCINVCNELVSAGAEYNADLCAVRELLREESGSFLLLGKKRRMMAGMLLGLPRIYRAGYTCYRRFFQKSVYD